MINPQLIFEDETILVCNKPAGLMVEPDRNNFPNLLQWVKNYLKEKTSNKDIYVQHLHRIDRPVSGLVLFTKQRSCLHVLSNQFAERKVLKKYYALTEKAPQQLQGTLINWHRKEKKKGQIVPEGTEFAEQVKLDYIISKHGDFYLWDINLHTGKFHQIRAQLAHVDCPIIGDGAYGSTVSYKKDVIALQAYLLEFIHPVSNQPIGFKLDLNL